MSHSNFDYQSQIVMLLRCRITWSYESNLSCYNYLWTIHRRRGKGCYNFSVFGMSLYSVIMYHFSAFFFTLLAFLRYYSSVPISYRIEDVRSKVRFSAISKSIKEANIFCINL